MIVSWVTYASATCVFMVATRTLIARLVKPVAAIDVEIHVLVAPAVQMHNAVPLIKEQCVHAHLDWLLHRLLKLLVLEHLYLNVLSIVHVLQVSSIDLKIIAI